MNRDEIINHVENGVDHKWLDSLVEDEGRVSRNMVWLTGHATKDRPDLDELRIQFLFESKDLNIIIKDSWAFDMNKNIAYPKPILNQAMEASFLFTTAVRRELTKLREEFNKKNQELKDGK